MQIDSPRLGSLEVPSDRVIEFPQGIPGFEHCRRFTVLEVEQSEQAYALLQSVDDPDVLFSVTTPDLLGLHYEFTLAPEEQALLGAERVEDVAVLLILRRSEAPGASVQANLMAPLVINVSARKGVQKIIARMGCEVTLKQA
ncbi:MAG: flagellar assembly protein FliW [Candidatus Dactylopiibacterium sp.]|nr:flagellar assembly protein FliW [Candidatus Dactylopiibacterium sp.]